MKVILFIGSHPRHAYLARTIAGSGVLSALVVEQREQHLPAPPSDLDEETANLFTHHFEMRARVENEFFSQADMPEVPTLEISADQLNSAQTQQFVEQHEPTLLISYGVHLLEPNILESVSGECWNIHGGLSPWYKGATTHFWPSYMLEPQMTGMTVHTLTNRLDAGDIIHQTAAPMVAGDTLHQVAARAVTALCDEINQLIALYATPEKIVKKPQNTNGKLWLVSDWLPAHLKLIYKDYHDKIVDYYLAGKLSQRLPELHRQFGN